MRANTRLHAPLDLPSPPLQTTTETLAESINTGILSSLVFPLERWVSIAKIRYERPVALALTGGYASAVAAHLAMPHRVEPLLTIKGLIALAAGRCAGGPDGPRRSGD